MIGLCIAPILIHHVGEALRNLQEYERNLNSMASTNLDTWFKDDLDHVNKWFSSLNDVERTATVYGLLQQLNRVQIRFFMTILRQMGQEDPVESLLSPAYPDKGKIIIRVLVIGIEC